MNCEVLIPLRNPTNVLARTIDSLVAQSDRSFSVLLSDNFSTTGAEHLEAAVSRLREAGIAHRVVRPPLELGRVEHWNWAHHAAEAEWLKPLFVGDWLDAAYFATARAALAEAPQCSYIFCAHRIHTDQGVNEIAPSQARGYFPPAEMQEEVLRLGMQFGPPSAALYRRTIFFQSGGYEPLLPICADCLLFCTLAARHGAYRITEPLANFLLHAARFSHTLPGKRRDTFRETLLYYAMLGGFGWFERWRFPVIGYARLLLRAARDYFTGRA